jgi:3-dehydrosphinganine reductase
MERHGQSAIITGGSSGIGKCIAKLLARRGANVFLIARREEVLKEAFKEVKQEAAASSQRFGCSAADVSNRTAIEQAIARAEAECGPPAVLVNCAGFVNPGYVEQLPIEGMETELKINYLGTVYTVKSVLDGMIKRRCGWILNVSSLGGIKGVFGYTGYSGSKFAVVGFSEALRSELRPYGIHVSVLCPPDVDTPMFENENKHKPLETLRVSEGAKLMQPADVAHAAVEGMEKGRFLIIPNFSGRMFALVNRIAPSVVDRIMNKTIDQVRKERGVQ